MFKRAYCIFYKNLYIGDSIKHPSKVKWKLTHGAGQFLVYVITKSETPGNQLEIIHCAYLKQSYFRNHPVFVYGIAGSYDEAIDIIIKISSEASASGMDGRLLDYLEGNS
ncbi:MAG: hypothetical protein K6B41_06410 [Butyrivibrio sp.]|nr:hypothetical protein [Butyrivibrio sp.]